ncbi:hypothetical protein BpHYR1_019686 [Brachionus plicatilis]|uniref:DUF3987 domain-containing protein n=1 Tax=Brachionus plicatilis TaxID=10195 RepID=A0A3M7P904_BRAPC|nr:hypothetical protein BpHYR1_019686 [Brachionus plicatilis]
MNRKTFGSSIEDNKISEIIRIQNILNKIPFENIFDGDLGQFLNDLSKTNSISNEFIVCPLLTAVSHLMKKSDVTALSSLQEQCVFYSALIANPSTGKSSALSLVKKSLWELENYLNIPRNKSSLINAGTVEALLTHLEGNSCLISLFDESATFMSSFGMYKNSDGKYDRSVYLELYTGPSGYDRTLSGNRHFIEMPRFNLCVLGHFSDYIDFVRQEKKIKDDGLIQRFHLCAPEPKFYQSEEMMSVPKLKYSLNVLFFIILKMNRLKVNYKLEPKAHELFCTVYDRYKQFCMIFGQKYDLFLAALCGKTASQILRVSMFIHSLKKSHSIMMMIKSKFIDVDIMVLNKKLENIVNKLTDKHESYYLISETTLKKSITLVDFFNKNKLAFAEYLEIDFNQDFFSILDFLTRFEFTSCRLIDSEKSKLARKILLFHCSKSLSFSANIINQRQKVKNVTSVIEAMQYLNTIKCGKFNEKEVFLID